jgi:tetratricopeptide (TPR) repeat protein
MQSRKALHFVRCPLTWLLCLFVIAVIAAVLHPVIHYDFMAWDDDHHIYANPRFQPLTWSHVGAFWRAPYLHLYIPLTYTVWAGLVWLSQTFTPEALTAELFHSCNLLFHLGSVLVVYRLAVLVLSQGRTPDFRQIGAAAAGALLFGLHPLQVEAVAWVSGLKDLLCAWWVLVALWQYLEYVSVPRGKQRWLHYGLATGAFGLALLAKPAAVVVPLLAWLLATLGMGQDRLQATRALAGWLGIAMLWSHVAKGQQPDTSMAYVTPWWGRPVVAADAVAFYLWKLVWPMQLGPDYGRAPQVVLGQAWGYLTGLIPVGLGGVLWWRWRQPGWKRGGLVAALFLAGLLPVLGWVPFFFQGYSTVADRYVYLSLLGPALGLSWGLYHLQRSRLMWVASGLLLALLGVRSAGQVQVWRDSLTLFTHAVHVNPGSALAHEKIGTALAQQQRFPEAVAHYTEALRLRPHYATVYNNLGLVLTQQGQLDEAMAHYTRALQLKPDFIEAYSNLGRTLAQQGRLDEAVAQYQAALAWQPDAAEVHYNLGNTLLRQGQLTEAISHYRRAVALRPAWAEAHNNLGSALDDAGHLTEAMAQYRTALRYKPAFAEAHNNLGDALLKQGGVAEASEQFRTAVSLKPAWAEASYNLGLALTRQGQLGSAMAAYRTALQLRPAWTQAARNLAALLVLQAHPAPQDVTEAVTLAEQVCQATDYHEAAALYLLALAYQAAARAPAAQATAQQALTLATAAGETALAHQISTHFALAELEDQPHGRP